VKATVLQLSILQPRLGGKLENAGTVNHPAHSLSQGSPSANQIISDTARTLLRRKVRRYTYQVPKDSTLCHEIDVAVWMAHIEGPWASEEDLVDRATAIFRRNQRHQSLIGEPWKEEYEPTFCQAEYDEIEASDALTGWADRLSKAQRAILRGLLNGHKQQELAVELGCSQPAISQALKGIRVTFQQAVAA
jgi:DNA-directed RNA polymerase specialized sigma24 family protein